MKRFASVHFLSGILVLGISATMFAAAPREILAPVEKIFIASGFDDNDNVDISVYGNFSDTCYRVGPTGYYVDVEHRKIQLWAKAYDYSAREKACLDVLTPFLLKISIGVIPEGDYTVEVVGQSLSTQLKITKSPSDSPDDFLYAPVTHTNLETRPDGKHELTISGQFPRVYNGCMKLKEVRSYRNPKDVLVVLPIAEFVNDSSQCAGVKLKFESKLIFDAFEDVGLLHVRVSNGNSQTQLITF